MLQSLPPAGKLAVTQIDALSPSVTDESDCSDTTKAGDTRNWKGKNKKARNVPDYQFDHIIYSHT